MEQDDKNIRQELIALVLEKCQEFWDFLKPNPDDAIFLQIIKSFLKLPVALFIIFISPVLLLILGIVFAILI